MAMAECVLRPNVVQNLSGVSRLKLRPLVFVVLDLVGPDSILFLAPDSEYYCSPQGRGALSYSVLPWAR